MRKTGYRKLVRILSGVLILIILEVLYEVRFSYVRVFEAEVLILIILEVLYENITRYGSRHLQVRVLILIILEVLYESRSNGETKSFESLNPYYTGSTL